MLVTVKITNVYGWDEKSHVETADVLPVPNALCEDSVSEWAVDELFPLTGDGRDDAAQAGHFVEIVECPAQPTLEGQNFEWC